MACNEVLKGKPAKKSENFPFITSNKGQWKGADTGIIEIKRPFLFAFKKFEICYHLQRKTSDKLVDKPLRTNCFGEFIKEMYTFLYSFNKFSISFTSKFSLIEEIAIIE